MAEHRNLTGDDLHEPKGITTATAGQVYEANGTGSGAWVNRLAGVLNLNRFALSGTIPDVSAPNSAFFAVVPQKASLSKLTAVLSGAITGSPSTLTIYKNNIAQTPTVNVNTTGSGPGVVTTATINPPIAFNESDVVEVRSNGNSDGAQPLNVSLSFTAVA